MEEKPKKFSIRWKRILRSFLSDGRKSYKTFGWKRNLKSFLSDGRESLEVLLSDAEPQYRLEYVTAGN
jgi:hypothetical protein